MTDISLIRHIANQFQVSGSDESLKKFLEAASNIQQKADAKNWDGEVRPEDFLVETYRDSNGGGFIARPEKNVRLTHRPTGLVVTSESERSSHGNKARAWESITAILDARKKENGEGVDASFEHLPEEAEMSMVAIGHLDLDDGRDWYYLVKRSDDILSLSQVEGWFLKKVYEEPRRPGGLFCNSVRCLVNGSAGDQFICIAQVRRDW